MIRTWGRVVPIVMRPLRREVRPARRRGGADQTWLTIVALVALGLTLGVYVAGR